MATNTTTKSSVASNVVSAAKSAGVDTNYLGNIAANAPSGGYSEAQLRTIGERSGLLPSSSGGGSSVGASDSFLGMLRSYGDATSGNQTAVITPESVRTPTPKLPTAQPENLTQWTNMLMGMKPGDNIQQQISDKGTQDMDIFKKMQDLIGEPPSTAEAYRQAQQDTGIIERQQKVNDLTAQLSQITSQAQANQLSTVGQGRGIPEAIIGGQQAQIAKEAAIQALPVSASLQAAQGNLEMAQQNLNTLFQIKSQDAKNRYEYKKNLVDRLFEIADKSEQRKLDYAMKIDDRRYAEQQSQIKYARDISEAAVKAGQPGLVQEIASLDVNSPTYMRDIMAVQSKVKDPLLSLEIEAKNLQIQKTKKEIESIGQPTPKERAEQAQKLLEAKSSVPIMKEKIGDINSLLTHSGKDSRVGQNVLMRKGGGLYGAQNFLTGAGDNFAATVHQLTAGLTLQNLIDAKNRGATFGALSEGELGLLADSATKLTDWEIKDSNGKGTGVWNIDRVSFDEELKTIRKHTQRALQLSGQNLFDDSEDELMSKVFNSQNMPLNVAGLFDN